MNQLFTLQYSKLLSSKFFNNHHMYYNKFEVVRFEPATRDWVCQNFNYRYLKFQEFGNYQEPIICNMWRGYTEINLSEDIQPILTVFVIVSSLERSEKFIILKKKNPTDFINKRLAFIICGTKCLCIL